MRKKQNSILRTLIILALLVVTLTAWAPVRNEFTPAEQQSISVETPGLFDKSKTIRIDMSLLRDDEYSFPLPVGKISQGKDNNVIITTSEGDAVKSMFDGCVRLSRKHPEFGNIIVVRHANGLETVYGNNAQNLVKVHHHQTSGEGRTDDCHRGRERWKDISGVCHNDKWRSHKSRDSARDEQSPIASAHTCLH